MCFSFVYAGSKQEKPTERFCRHPLPSRNEIIDERTDARTRRVECIICASGKKNHRSKTNGKSKEILIRNGYRSENSREVREFEESYMGNCRGTGARLQTVRRNTARIVERIHWISLRSLPQILFFFFSLETRIKL